MQSFSKEYRASSSIGSQDDIVFLLSVSAWFFLWLLDWVVPAQVGKRVALLMAVIVMICGSCRTLRIEVGLMKGYHGRIFS
jgi:hypothetical protein